MQPTPRPSRITWARVIGGTLIGTGIIGLVLSLVGIGLGFYLGGRVQAALGREIAILDRSLAATSNGLVLASKTLADTEKTLDSLSTTITAATRAITETQPTIDAVRVLTGEQLPQTIGSTREALDTARETAGIIDRVLGTAAIFGVPYNPEVPLNVAIGQVSDSLAEVPGSLIEASKGLEKAGDNIETLAGDLQQLAAGLEAISTNVEEAGAVVAQYQDIVRDLQLELASIREAAPRWLAGLRLAVALLLIWMALTQIALLRQGWELLRRDAASGPVEPQAQEEQSRLV